MHITRNDQEGRELVFNTIMYSCTIFKGAGEREVRGRRRHHERDRNGRYKRGQRTDGHPTSVREIRDPVLEAGAPGSSKIMCRTRRQGWRRDRGVAIWLPSEVTEDGAYESQPRPR